MSEIGKIIRVNELPPAEEMETNVIYQLAELGSAKYIDYAVDENGDVKVATLNLESMESDEVDAWKEKLGVVDINPNDYLEKSHYLNESGKILASEIESLGLLDTIKADENNLQDFIVNNENYDYQKNDIIAIPQGTNPETFILYLFIGDDKQIEEYYLPTGSISGPSTDTLTDVMNRDNTAPLPVKFNEHAQLWFDANTYSYFFNSKINTGTGTSNIGIGYDSMTSLTTGEKNTAVGIYTGSKLTSGMYNTFIGQSSGYNSTTGNGNTFLGEETGFNTTNGFKNTFVGTATGYNNTTGRLNTNIGYKANTTSNLGDRNVILGAFAGQGVTGHNNVLIGVGAGTNNGSMSNKLIIHGNHTLSGYSNTSEGSYGSFQQSQLAMALVTGDFVSRWFKINGAFQVTGTATINELQVTNDFIPQGNTIIEGFLILPPKDGLPSSAEPGTIMFNDEDKKHYGYDGVDWHPLY